MRIADPALPHHFRERPFLDLGRRARNGQHDVLDPRKMIAYDRRNDLLRQVEFGDHTVAERTEKRNVCGKRVEDPLGFCTVIKDLPRSTVDRNGSRIA